MGFDHATRARCQITHRAQQEVQMQIFTMYLNDYMDYILDFPELHVDSYSHGLTLAMPSTHFVPFGGTSSSGRTKRKSPMVDVVDSQFLPLTT